VLLAAMIKSRPLRKKDLANTVAAVGGSVSSMPSVEMKKILRSEH
jgi:hypothetical protein